MITIEKTPNHVLALRLSGTVEKADVASMAKAFTEKFAGSDRVGIVIDMSDWSDMTGDAIVEDMKFELSQLGKIGRIPRMAIVTDKQFVLAIMNVFRPIFPMIDVKVFGARAYDQALAFVSELPVAIAADKPAVTMIATGSPKLLGFELDGVFTKEDVERLVGPLQRAFEQDGKIDLLARMKNYAGFDPSIVTDSSLLSMKLSAISRVRRYAVVGAPGWMMKIAGMFVSVLPIEVRFFKGEQEDAAWAWLKS